jgi:hypothetical protein
MIRLLNQTKKTLLLFPALAAVFLLSCSEEKKTVQPQPNITDLSIKEGVVGTKVTITGINFGTIVTDVEVSFGCTKAVVSAVTETLITTTVPTGATSGNVKVKIKLLEANGPAFTVLAPVTVSVSAFTNTIAENPTLNAVLGTVTASTNRGSLVYSLTAQAPAGAMAINSSTGALTVANAGLFNFEVNPSITGVVSVANGSETATANITITVSNVIEVTIVNYATTVAENLAINSVIGSVSATGENKTVTLSNQSPDGALSIDAATGQLIVANAAAFDFEVNPTISATVSVTGGSEVKTASVTLTLTNVVEVTISDFTTTINENPVENASLGTVTTTGTSTKSFSITTQTPTGALAIDAATGQLTVANRLLFDFETRTSITATVRVESQSEIKTASATITIDNVVFTEPANLIAKYLFESNTLDGSGNGYNATTNTQSPTFTADRFGISSRALAFNGAQYMEVPQITAFNIETITVSFWFKTNSTSVTQRFLALGSAAQNRQNWSANYNVNDNPAKADFRHEPPVANGSGTFAPSISVVNTNTWRHFTGVRDGATKTIKIYIDGVLERTVSYLSSPVSADTNLQIGRYSANTNQYYTGSMDDIRIFSRALSAGEITSLQRSEE